MRRLHAIFILGWHFAKHWLRKVLFLYRAGGRKRFNENYAPDGLLPTSADRREVLASWQSCVGCGLCDALCPASPAIPALRLAGPMLMVTAGLRDPSHHAVIRVDASALASCESCRACDDICPVGVPIHDVLHALAESPDPT